MIIKLSHSGEQKPQAVKAIEYILRPKDGQGKNDRILALQSNSDLPFFDGIEPDVFAHNFANQIEETFLHRNKKPQKFLYDHIIFSYAVNDKLTPDQAIGRAKEALLDYWNQSRKNKRKKPLMELPTDFLLAAQNDSENGILHVHGIVGRRDKTGFYNNHTQNYKALRSIAMGIEDRYGYTTTQKTSKTKANPANHKEWQDVNNGKKNTKFHVRKCVERAIKKSGSVKEFMELMKMQKIYAVPNISSTGKMNGFKFRHDGEYFTASQLHRSFGWANMSQQINFDPDKDLEILKRMAQKIAEKAEKVDDNDNALYGTESNPKAQRKFDNRYALHRIMKADEGGVYRYSRFDRVAFCDHGTRISFQTTSDTAVKAALQLCIEKGWTTVRATGNEQFKAKSWLHGQAMGLNITGYEPSADDIQKLYDYYGIDYQPKPKAPVPPIQRRKETRQKRIGEEANNPGQDQPAEKAPSERQRRLVDKMRRIAGQANKKRPRTPYDEYYDKFGKAIEQMRKNTGVDIQPTVVQACRYIARNMLKDGYSPDKIYSELYMSGGVDRNIAEKIVRATLDYNEKDRLRNEAYKQKSKPKPRKPRL
jgi:hypothetical protein